MKKLVVLIAVAAFIGTVTMAAFASNGPAQITFPKGKKGEVVFNHQAHQGYGDDCATCHHTGMDKPNCKSCHNVDPAIKGSKDAYHKQCKDCHKAKGKKTGCSDCHAK